MEINNRWARGYAKQALSDLQVREILTRNNIEKCHRLHFLQMAAEKTCKAYLTICNGHEKVRKSHAYIAKNLPIIARQFYSILNDENQIAHWELAQIKRLAEEIELLAPACEECGSRKDNSEYPWEDAKGNIKIPCEYNFPNIHDNDRQIIKLIKIIRVAAEKYLQ